MKAIIEGPPDREAARPSWPRRLAWFFGLALASSAVTAVVAFILKALLPSP
jgi:hypothetical protein